jgi:hypothetical protein
MSSAQEVEVRVGRQKLILYHRDEDSLYRKKLCRSCQGIGQ